MPAYHYCTPQWLEQSAEIYQSNHNAQNMLKKLTANMSYRVKADPGFGIDHDIIFCAFFKHGKLTRLSLISEKSAITESDYIMAATPATWKKILQKERKFVTDFMLGNIKLEKGSKIGVLGVAPHANNIVDALTPVDLVFGDDLSEDERQQYRKKMALFRKELGV